MPLGEYDKAIEYSESLTIYEGSRSLRYIKEKLAGFKYGTKKNQRTKGNVVSYLKENEVDFDYYYACGPQVMLKYLALYNSNGCVSLEARMGCGFGACMGCSIETTKGPKRVCKEGPVFNASEVIF